MVLPRRPDLSPAVAAEHRRLLDKPILPRWADVPLGRLRTADVDPWYSELRRSGAGGGKPLASNTVMRAHALPEACTVPGRAVGLANSEPGAERIAPPRSKNQHLELPDVADVARLIGAAAKVNASLSIFLRLAAAGARRGAVCGLRWKHIGLEKRRVTVARSMAEAGGELIERTPRPTRCARSRSTTTRWRCSPLAARACEELAAKCGATLTATSFLFSHEVDFSKPWRPNYATLASGRLRDELGLDGVKLQHLRQFSATQLLSAGIDIRTVSGRLGQANASTTLNFDAQFLQAADERAAQTGCVVETARLTIRSDGGR